MNSSDLLQRTIYRTVFLNNQLQEYATENGCTMKVALTSGSGATSASSDVVGLSLGATFVTPIELEDSLENSTCVVVPGAPTNVVAVGGDGSATISFAAPSEDGGSPIVRYIVRIVGSLASAEGSSSPITVGGLLNGVSYTFTVSAVNARGESAASVTSAAVTPVAAVPGAPTAVVAVGGDGEAEVSFTAPLVTGSTPITSYTVTAAGGSGGSATGAASPISVGGLTNGVSYTFTVVATNSGGSSAASAASAAVTPVAAAIVPPSPGSDEVYTGSLLIRLDAGRTSSYSGSGSIWSDISGGSAFNATLVGGPTFSSDVGGYFSFNGSGQYATIPDTAAIRATVGGAVTAQIWARVPADNTGEIGLIGKQFGAPSYDGFGLMAYGSNKSLQLNMNGATVDGRYYTGINQFTPGDWALFTCVVRFGGGTNNKSKIYINDVLIEQFANTESFIPSITAPLELAKRFGSTSRCDIAAFYYYARELTAAEIADNYEATKGRFIVPT